MYIEESDYLCFLQRPRFYIEREIVLDHMGYNPNLCIEYPVCRCWDITLYFNHYPDYNLAKDRWEKRKQRINWENLFVMMYTENKETADVFDSLPYDKKICFVPFRTDRTSCYTLHFSGVREMKSRPLFNIVASMASGVIPYYDPVKLLLEGKVVSIADESRI